MHSDYHVQEEKASEKELQFLKRVAGRFARKCPWNILNPVDMNLEDLYTESGQTSHCSFSASAISPPLIARVGAFFSTFRDLQDLQYLAPLESQNFHKKGVTNLVSLKL